MRRPSLTVKQILAWADQYHAENGRWPEIKDGKLCWADESWYNIDQALRVGLRGLLRGQSLARLLDKNRGKRNRKRLPKFTLKQILGWADEHHQRTGRWPRNNGGLIPNTRGETWLAVEMALSHGQRGLSGGSSLACLLATQRGVISRTTRPKLTLKLIKSWIERFRQENEFFPTSMSGPIPWNNGDSWHSVDQALRCRGRGLRKRSSLVKLLNQFYGIGRHRRRPPFSIEQILIWADEHKQQTGRWPKAKSGRIAGTSEETWCRVNDALMYGKRGLKGGGSLAMLLSRHRGVRTRVDRPGLQMN